MSNRRVRILSSAMLALIAGVAGVLLSLSVSRAQTSRKKLSPSAITNATPQGAVRAFMIAMISQDKASLRKVLVPIPESDLAKLTAGQKPPEEFKKHFLAQISFLPVTLLKPGDTVMTPSGRSMTVPEIADGKTMILAKPEGSPLPFLLVKKADKWLVDARPIITAREAAAKSQKSAKQP